MAQVSKYPVQKEVADRIFELFIKTLINVKDKDEAEKLVADLLTPTERIMLAKRLTIAFLLEKGYEYSTIKGLLRVSSPTIAAVSLACQYGSKGYKKLIDKISREESISKFLREAAIKLVSMPAASAKGGSSWRYLKQELEKEKRKREKTF